MTKERKTAVREWLYITIGILIMTAGIYFFKFPNHFSTGGVTGIAIILGHYIPSVTPATLVTIKVPAGSRYAPKTGDEARVGFWAGMMLLSGSGLAAAGFGGRKQRKPRRAVRN